ncbi:MAG TPA: hypothetical protein VKY19_03610 [Ktedonosporobacter sp.]|jgi:hypothetical protein|nr:hypothetical protein [Ktedonosporobacter sp.]
MATTDQKLTRDEPAYRKLQRICLAGCIMLAPLIVLLGFAFDPTGGVPPAPAGIFAAYQAASPLKIQLFLFFNAITPYVFPLSFIGLGLLAMRRSPWLATLGMICGLVGTLPFGFFVWPEALGDAMVKAGNSSTFQMVWSGVASEGVIVFLQYSWVVGHLLGYILLGIALARARTIPLWAAGLIILGIPCQAVAYMTHQGIFQLLSYALIFIGSIPAALAMLSRTYEKETVEAV